MNLLLFCTQVLVDYVPSSATSLLANPHIYDFLRKISEESLTHL